MRYNAEELLSALKMTILNIDDIFHEGKNDDFILSLGKNLFNGDYNYFHGASKFVIIPNNNADYVIKIPYTGSWNRESGYYSSNYGHYHRSSEEYQDFSGSDSIDRPWDYCAGEVLRYTKAKEYNLNKCFAETKFLGLINDYPIYVQEKCVTFSSCVLKHTHSIEEISITSKVCNYQCISPHWLTDFRLYYGDNFLIKFVNFIKNMQWDDDLRSDNIGYLNSRPILIDYSGFLE